MVKESSKVKQKRKQKPPSLKILTHGTSNLISFICWNSIFKFRLNFCGRIPGNGRKVHISSPPL